MFSNSIKYLANTLNLFFVFDTSILFVLDGKYKKKKHKRKKQNAYNIIHGYILPL